MSARYEIVPFLIAECDSPEPRVFYLGDPSRSVHTHFYFWLLRSGTTCALVDTGFGGSSSARFMPQIRKSTPSQHPVAQLQGRDVAASDITTVILTHAHWDHLSDIGFAFENARFYVQRREFEFLCSPPHPWFRQMVDWEVLSTLAARKGRLVLLDGDQEIMPGVSVLATPGHTFGHQSVLVDTRSGRACIAGDACFFQRSLDEDCAPGFNTSLIDCFASLARLRSLQQQGITVLPGHDPLVLDRCEDRRSDGPGAS